MVNQDEEFLGIDKNSGFSLRVLVLSVPAGLIFFILAVLEILPISLAISSYVSILFFNTVFLMPMSLELQKIKKYIRSLSSGVSEEDLLKDMSEKETRDLTEAINSMHRFWADKTEMLENRTLSDAAVLDTLPEPLLMVNKSGVIIGANRAVRLLFNDDLKNKQIGDLITDTMFHTTLNKILSLESRNEDMRLCLNDLKNKPKFHVNMTTLPWFAKGEVVAVISFHDLHKVLQFEQMQQDFVANASHELRTPLSIISGFIETLQTSAKDDEKAREKFLKVIGEQTVYMSSLIEDLLSLSKVEMSLDQVPQDKINVNNIIREICTALTIKLQENHLKINSKFARLPQITADEQQITQVLQNLLSNAVKYATPETEIIVSTQKEESIPQHKYYEVAEGPAVVIKVANWGVTISEEDLSRLTERFYRLQAHKNHNIRGTGLGLSIVTQIIRRHHGNMEITSVDGLTTFKVYLPVHIE